MARAMPMTPPGAVGTIDDLTKYLLDCLDRTLQDSHVMGSSGLGLTITFAMAVLVAHAQGHELIRTRREKQAFSGILVLAFGVYATILIANWRDLNATVALLEQLPPAFDRKLSLDDLHRVLATKSQLQHAGCLLALRLCGVAIPLFILWAFMVELGEAIRRWRGHVVG